ncbi:MAG: ribosomal protein S18-alanine N-acetyltransferase [Bifidobacteriaceae bacterium]|jgi:ribosomal-protein-alanine N-acetyltransferase|nr:ribosomal protein S18-alanine N-acetyltransferase [Bifidobacteriaceae bacterium]
MLKADLPAIAELEKVCFGAEAWSLSMLAEELDGIGRTYVVAAAEGVVLGYGGVFVGPDFAEIMTIAVDPAQRGLGYGRLLMDHLLAVARAGGASHVFLEVATDLGPARGLYDSLGFVPLGIRKRYYQPSGRDAIMMRLTLVGPGLVSDVPEV